MSSFHQNRVVATGLGIIAPNGIGAADFWSTLVSGKSAISRIESFDASGLRSQIAGEVKNFDASRRLRPDFKLKRCARHTQFALCATVMALKDAGIREGELGSEFPVPIMVGIASSSWGMIAESGCAIERRGPKHASTAVIMDAIPHSVAGAIAEYLRVPNSGHTYSSACAAGLDAIAEGAELIRRGEADLVIAGGTETPISLVPFANFDSCGMSSRQNEAPEKASRPFDMKRDSGVISEGCAMIVLENLESARARGARPYLEILGSGVHTDEPEQSCSGFAHSMRKALANAGLLPADVDYICAWGPSHPMIDKIETDLIKRVFGQHAYHIPVSSIKGVIGNPLAAAGPLMIASCCLAFRNNLIPPTANYEFPDPDCDLDYVPNAARPAEIQCALLNGHGVGGANTSMVLGRV